MCDTANWDIATLTVWHREWLARLWLALILRNRYGRNIYQRILRVLLMTSALLILLGISIRNPWREYEKRWTTYSKIYTRMYVVLCKPRLYSASDILLPFWMRPLDALPLGCYVPKQKYLKALKPNKVVQRRKQERLSKRCDQIGEGNTSIWTSSHTCKR